MSELQKCPECPWTGYGLSVHIGVMHHSIKQQKERARLIERIATLLETTENITMPEILRLSQILLERADEEQKRRKAESKEIENIYNQVRERLLMMPGGLK